MTIPWSDVARSGSANTQFPYGSFWKAALVIAPLAIATVPFVLDIPAKTGDVGTWHHTAMHMAGTSDTVVGGRPTTIVKPISCQKLPNAPGMSLTLALVDFPPNSYTPRHRHPGSVTAYVLKGTLRSQLAGAPAETYSTGETWFEPPGTVHLFAENASTTEPAEILAMFVTEEDCGPLVIPD
jgi:quercetin dioxygenase-like cupin family protein